MEDTTQEVTQSSQYGVRERELKAMHSTQGVKKAGKELVK